MHYYSLQYIIVHTIKQGESQIVTTENSCFTIPRQIMKSRDMSNFLDSHIHAWKHAQTESD